MSAGELFIARMEALVDHDGGHYPVAEEIHEELAAVDVARRVEALDDYLPHDELEALKRDLVVGFGWAVSACGAELLSPAEVDEGWAR